MSSFAEEEDLDRVDADNEQVEEDAGEAENEDENSNDDGNEDEEEVEGDGDSSDEPDEDDEMTEADKQFIVEDEEEDEGDVQRRKRKRRKREEDETLDDEDLELINENYGRPKKEGGLKRLRKKGISEDSRESTDLANMFFNDTDEQADKDTVPQYAEELPDDDLGDSDDEDGGFIVEDEVEEGMEDVVVKRPRDRKELKNKLSFVQQYGISEDTMSKIEELFNDSIYAQYLHINDQSNAQTQADGHGKKASKITDIYEPSEIAEKMLTDKDEAIRMRDLPERFQTGGEPSNLSKEDMRRAAVFVVRKLLEYHENILDKLEGALQRIRERKLQGRPVEDPQAADTIERDLLHQQEKLYLWKDKEALLEKVEKVLEFINENKFEVPFILAHRKDYFASHLDRADLWKVHDFNLAFHALETKRTTARTTLQELRAVSDLLLTDRYPDALLDEARSIEDVHDVTSYLQLYYHSDLQRVEETRKRVVKKSIRRSEYENARKFGILNYVQKLNVDVKAYVQSIAHGTDYNIEDVEQEPHIVASTFIVDRSPYSTPERVMEAGRSILAFEIATDPKLRKFIRKIYETDAVVTVTPTEKGKKEIHYSHPYYPFKFLSKKPVFKFDNAQFLQIHAAEAAGLVEVALQVEQEDKLLEDIVKQITNDYTNAVSEKWNEERKKAAEYAAKDILFPQMAKWLKEKLCADASIWLAEQCRVNMEQKIDVAPFPKPESEYDDDESRGNLARVLAISWGDGERDSPTVLVGLDESGRVDFGSYTKLTAMHDRERKQKDLETIYETIRDFRPDVIVVGGWSLATVRLLSEISGVSERFAKESASASSKSNRRHRENKPLEVVMVDDDIARLKMSSTRFAREFPESFPPLARYCVSLGRKVQDTTMEYASLFNTDDEIKLLRVHPLQELLGDEKLKATLERAMINVVNSNGVDINEAALYPHRSYTLQFVSGLGPRKAKSLIDGILKLRSTTSKERDRRRLAGLLNSRNDLILFQLLAWNVFLNCASFLRVKRKYFLDFNEGKDHDVLDDTRIHPEDYDLARKMAADALELDDVLDTEENDSQNVLELMENRPEKLDDLLLDDYAVELEKTSNTKKRIVLNEIKDEIKAPYRDRRRRFTSSTYREIFYMLSNETEESLRMGTVVSCQVTKVTEKFLKIRLNSGVEGLIHASNLPLPTFNYKDGQIIDAGVKNVDLQNRHVELDARLEVIGRDWLKEFARNSRDDNFDDIREEESREKKQLIQIVKPKQARVVNHPFWKNVSFQEAVAALSGKDVKIGSVIIRPSTKGTNHLSITWKVHDDLFQHVDIVESNKENDWSLGRILTIDGKNYDDLDEIIATYIEPLARNFSDALGHAKFRNSDLRDMYRWVESQLLAQKRSIYGIIICREKPGRFYLVFQHLGTQARHEYIQVTPEGFMFRNATFKRLDQLFDGFKKMEANKAKDAARKQAAAPPPRQQLPPNPMPMYRPMAPQQMPYIGNMHPQYPPYQMQRPPPNRYPGQW